MKFKINPYKDHAVMDDDWESIAHEYFTINKQRKNLAKREEFLKEKLQVLSMDKSARTAKYAFSKIERIGAVDYKRLVAEHASDVNTDPYRKDTTHSWRISRI